MARHKWTKVYNDDAINITYQSCGSTPTKYWVDTFATAYGYQDPHCLGDGGSGDSARCNRDGELWAGTNYVFCKKPGDRVTFGTQWNHWWLLTDLDDPYDGRDGRSFVSAYYLSRWGNDVAKDNRGRDIPDC